MTIPNSVIFIGQSAFYACSELESIVIPNGITIIERDSFYGCGLTNLTIPDSVITIGYSAFNNCSKLKNVHIGKGVRNIEAHAFGSCYALETVTIEDGLTTIGSNAFWLSGKPKMVIPTSVTTIASNAFVSSYLPTVYYKGTEQEWNLINFSGNNCITKASRYYYSATSPTDEGNYWHYDENSMTILEW